MNVNTSTLKRDHFARKGFRLPTQHFLQGRCWFSRGVSYFPTSSSSLFPPSTSTQSLSLVSPQLCKRRSCPGRRIPKDSAGGDMGSSRNIQRGSIWTTFHESSRYLQISTLQDGRTWTTFLGGSKRHKEERHFIRNLYFLTTWINWYLTTMLMVKLSFRGCFKLWNEHIMKNIPIWHIFEANDGEECR